MKHFNFGVNWLDYSDHALNEKQLSDAKQSLQILIGQHAIQNHSFMDIGSGSGIFSIAAAQLGAQPVIGFDISSQSIAAAEKNKQRFTPDATVSFRQASILDDTIHNFTKSDIVYSWGVLHHTGRMWPAIENAISLVADGGTFVIALYNRHWTSLIWRGIKWTYNNSPKFVQKIMVAVFFTLSYVGKFLTTFKNPLRKDRGMNFYYDVVDWIGGYPYEYASVEEVIDFFTQRGFVLTKLITVNQRKGPRVFAIGCNEFVFKKTRA